MRQQEAGFTLIELLVTIGIIGILSATALVRFLEYRERAFDARAQSDLRNIISAEEAYYADNETFVGDITVLTGFDATSPAVTAILAATPTGWSGSSYHPSGSQTYCYNSLVSSSIVAVPGLASPCP